ncbi:hypothetical protein IRJ41_022543 [Triplophysa rosa]|uniref:Uncharacterized protein n=1 Tax=Triplophysa rosa TaxID=992332 RepID=A0A9W8CAD1_TRIRA|nr:hypothetical protein IRJ41_022543 [Triplophysa rosa]
MSEERNPERNQIQLEEPIVVRWRAAERIHFLTRSLSLPHYRTAGGSRRNPGRFSGPQHALTNRHTSVRRSIGPSDKDELVTDHRSDAYLCVPLLPQF